MLYLFIQPLRTGLKRYRSKRIATFMKRVAFSAFVCFFVDCLVTIMFIFRIPDISSCHVIIIVCDIKLLVNILSVILSFDTWR